MPTVGVSITSRAGGTQHALSTGFIPDQGSGFDLTPVIAREPSGVETSDLQPTVPSTDSFLADQRQGRVPEVRIPPLESIYYRTDEETKTVPIQLWEGRVIEIDVGSNSMHVYLTAKIGNVADHTADIDLQWVHPQDQDLVRPGAIFYLTLFKETKRGSIHNNEELRFRRLPSWSKRQIEQIRAEAARLLARINQKPQAD